VAGDLARAVSTCLPGLLKPPPDLLEPVPLSRSRLRERGFNQSSLVARHVSDQLGLPLSHSLRRIRHTHPQADLPRERRLLNPNGAFRANTTGTRGKAVLLLDDVVTTGATMAAARRALLEAEARSVACLAIAGSELGGPKPVD
jgi:ComF family protein